MSNASNTDELPPQSGDGGLRLNALAAPWRITIRPGGKCRTGPKLLWWSDLALLLGSVLLGFGIAAENTGTAFAETPDLARQDTPAAIAFFESEIRPALIEHCLDCHASETEISGGLNLDSRQGWLKGGDLGAAIVPGDADASLLIKAIEYSDPELQMPPDGRLSKATVAAFRKWIDEGAADPREEIRSSPATDSTGGLGVEQATDHWAYRPVDPEARRGKGSVPGGVLEAAGFVDRLIDSKALDAGLSLAPPASPRQLARRLSFDLTGLPPEPEALRTLVNDPSPAAYQRFVDGLLTSPAYGEHFARHWMDVVRYAESITLRGFVLPEAWRYRDYLIDAYNDDRPFDQMIRDQIAGDLYPAEELAESQRRRVATAFLAMGNSNLEDQDKTKLEFDHLDEQLETLGRAFLAQTIGCARCHDHKFDPIPTRDYYALAAILRSTTPLEHANLSKWIEKPLPLEPSEEERYRKLEQEIVSVDQSLKALKSQDKRDAQRSSDPVDPATLGGTVIDDEDAVYVGRWEASSFIGPFVGIGYRHDQSSSQRNREAAIKTATFEPETLAPGVYEVRLAYTPHPNRATNTSVTVFSANESKTVRLNQRRVPSDGGVWVSLGTFPFEKDGQSFVIVSNEAADGCVVVDAVQFRLADSKRDQKRQPPANETDVDLNDQIKTLSDRLNRLKKRSESRPKYLTISESEPRNSIAVRIRGNVHQEGPMVERGFLSAVGPAAEYADRIPADRSGRSELAEWIADPRNPLTARVYANRIWCWLMGDGLVASENNFGTTGQQPTHPDLLDFLASELIESGWSTKHLVRCIVQSRAYRRAVMDDPRRRELDPANRLWAAGSLKRIPVESLRDAVLLISGELDRQKGGPTLRPNTRSDYDYEHDLNRRSVYLPVLRNSLPPLYEAFDFADASVSVGQRPRSTVAPQSLAMLNHPWVIERCRQAAAHWSKQMSGRPDSELITELYLACFGRPPEPAELDVCQRFLGSHDGDGSAGDSRADRLADLIQSLVASIDFRFLE